MKKISLSIWWLTLGSILILIIGYLTNYAWHRLYIQSENDTKGELHQGGYNYISPLLECSDIHDIKQSNLEDKLKNIIKKNVDNNNITYASLYFRDLNNGPWIGINEQEEFTPASLLKVPLMIAYLKLAEDDINILNDNITIENEVSNLSQNILPLQSVKLGETYTVDTLLKYMIMYSDNGAANALLQHMNPDYLDQIYNDFNIIAPGNNIQTENFMNVKDYASFFRILYNASYLNREMSEKALEILTSSQFDQGLKAGLPDNIKLAHKFGERVWLENKQLHDCGIVYKTNMPYLLCVMTRGGDFSKMSAVIKELSDTVYKDFK